MTLPGSLPMLTEKGQFSEIANMLQLTPDLPVQETIEAFERYFNMGLLSWRDGSADPPV